MRQSIKSSDLKKMRPEQQEEAMRGLVRVAPGASNGEIRALEQRIQAFETQHRISSDELRHELAQGKRKESWEICQWLMLLGQRDLLGSQKTRSR